MVEYYRAAKGKAPVLKYRYYISSADLTPEQVGNAIRADWGIESMHWIIIRKPNRPSKMVGFYL